MNKFTIVFIAVVLILTPFLIKTVVEVYTVKKQTLCIERAKAIGAAHKFDTETFKCTVTTVDGSSFKF